MSTQLIPAMEDTSKSHIEILSAIRAFVIQHTEYGDLDKRKAQMVIDSMSEAISRFGETEFWLVSTRFGVEVVTDIVDYVRTYANEVSGVPELLEQGLEKDAVHAYFDEHPSEYADMFTLEQVFE